MNKKTNPQMKNNPNVKPVDDSWVSVVWWLITVSTGTYLLLVGMGLA